MDRAVGSGYMQFLYSFVFLFGALCTVSVCDNRLNFDLGAVATHLSTLTFSS